jgi:hypothetical protein
MTEKKIRYELKVGGTGKYSYERIFQLKNSNQIAFVVLAVTQKRRL